MNYGWTLELWANFWSMGELLFALTVSCICMYMYMYIVFNLNGYFICPNLILYLLLLMVLRTPMAFTQTLGIVSVLLNHPRTRGQSVARMRDFWFFIAMTQFMKYYGSALVSSYYISWDPLPHPLHNVLKPLLSAVPLWCSCWIFFKI